MIVARAPGRARDGVVRRVGSGSVAAVAELMERMLQGVFEVVPGQLSADSWNMTVPGASATAARTSSESERWPSARRR
jgi:hypothetical protein